ncbi:cell wall metabolism sensor histidine kinase WalK [Heyndrickxia ginsengihumi]|uniref:histidine kinase n=1 Tax=Heyndrickxia ginsengihumi TaxID=363870 RepID=A0A0A6XXI9_9BACI|nr:cell wall metabolism sensor histidine kinase WalK [Heyndrickxia ginsengihumi]KHD84797.1 histidine kinase [Heyndrickxia ginsengihumi]MBE6184982.1 cell wall metabolism sensor histidine kinase WalK [Bacillus sp. (in: firmicutes)]MCM3024138.1 cell wall metabolism sensor histidine kinase WalK [Heyndrickxia ginsengihumi]NEY18586.1 cell wall metabolism sensor histidine kinase WalK [Heyndrickxia ginsengihumi]
MKKVNFFQSIHFKIVIIYILLIIVAMEIIGVYFINKLEDQLESNFKKSIYDQVNVLEYSIQDLLTKKQNQAEDVTSEIRKVLSDFNSSDVSEIRLIDGHSGVILGTSNNQGIVGQKTSEKIVKTALETGEKEDEIYLDKQTGDRMWVLASPIKSNGDVIGIVYLVSKIESVYRQVQAINQIFMTGTVIALFITALLGIIISRTISRPISEMRRQAIAMARGNFSRKVKVKGNDEIGQLAISFNHMTKKLQEAQANTEGERRKFASILTHMTDGVIATDRRGRVILINDPAEELLDVSRETVLSQPLVSVLKVEDEHCFEDLLTEQDSIILDFSTKEEPYILRANFSAIQNEAGFVSGLITVLHDITEQEKIDMERREFVANVSHELRTPLTTMRSYLEALADGAWKDEQIAPQFLSVTQNETERMIRLVNDLLKLSKLDSKDGHLNKEMVNFTEFFQHIIDRFEMTKEQNVTFKRKLPKTELFVEIDEDKLTQVLYNIISNALKYSPEGGQITFRVKEFDERIEVSISDQGVGIPKENVKKIFERFYRVDKARSRKMGGTGLGLAIAKEMVELHGGRIWASSQEGKGTTIYFTLPYERTQEDEWS